MQVPRERQGKLAKVLLGADICTLARLRECEFTTIRSPFPLAAV